MPRSIAPLLAAIIAAALLWPAPAAVAADSATATGVTYVAETGHNLGGAFKKFYEANGGLAIFGLPLTEMFVEDGLWVQYFERARFELHHGGVVALTRVGAELTNGRTEPAFQWLGEDPNNGRRYIAASGHTLGGAFAVFWDEHGGVGLFGYPISEEFTEVGPDGVPRTVQYFERARFELADAPDGSGHVVQLGLIGRELLERRPAAQAMAAPAPPLTLLGSATTGFNSSAADRRINIERAAAMFDGVVVMPGEEHSFLAGGDFSEAAGFVEGYGIVGGRLERVIGGGLCQVSTTLFRAVANAGLEVTRRIGHTYVVYFYENILGFDATVFSPGVDFRWRNDMGAPVLVTSHTDQSAGTVTFEIWGTSEGRSVRYSGPHVRNVVKPGVAIWQYDPTLAPGQIRQLVHGRAGMDVSLQRVVTGPDGSVIRQETFNTRYRPWEDYFVYGPGVTPPAGVRVINASRTAATTGR
ncbi:MAG: VanW family protein [Chloroflexota bacterium]|nr:MAG: vanomycin resistance protein VanB [Chloroflexota bacterium]